MGYYKKNIKKVSVIVILLLAILACNTVREFEESYDEPLQPLPVCTQPACANNEIYFCEDECPNSCGIFCVMFTPAPNLLYTEVALIDVKLSDTILEISMDVVGIEGGFYGVATHEDFECGIWQPEEHSERLFCKGKVWFSDSAQTLRVYRNDDDKQAFQVDFMMP